MNDKYMVFVPGSATPPEGPFDVAELRARAQSGALPDNAKVSVVGSSDWQPIASVIGAPPTAPPAGAPPAAAPRPASGAARSRSVMLFVAVGAAVALVAVVVIAVAVSRSRSRKASSPPVPTAAPLSAADLDLDFSNATDTTLPTASHAALDMSWKKLEATWDTQASRFHIPASWNRGAALGIWMEHEPLGPGVEAQVMGMGHDTIVSAAIEAHTDKATPQAVFNAMEILRNVVEPALGARKLYGGLGLLSPPPTRKRRFQSKYQWELRFKPKHSLLTLSATGIHTPNLGLSHGFALDVDSGQTLGRVTMTGFQVKYLPASRGKSFEDAAKVCQDAGLELCSATQWRRACGQFNKLGTFQSWTSSYTADYSVLQVRGGTGCDASNRAHASDSVRDRIGLCCNPSIAWPDDTSIKTPGLVLVSVRIFQQGLNRRDPSLLREALAPQMDRYYTVQDISRDKAVKLSMDYMTKHPGFWSVIERCKFGSSEDGDLTIQCLRNVFNGAKGMLVNSTYELNTKFDVAYVRDGEILRRMSPL